MQLPNIKDARIRTKEKIEVSYDKYKVPESIHNIGHNKTYTILTYGCQMNVHDSENISGIMEDLGYTKEENYEKNCISMQWWYVNSNACKADERGFRGRTGYRSLWGGRVFRAH